MAYPVHVPPEKLTIRPDPPPIPTAFEAFGASSGSVAHRGSRRRSFYRT